MKKTFSLIAMLSILTTGCASIMTPQSKDVFVSSNEEDVQIYRNGMQLGITNGIVQLPNNKDTTLEFRKEGFKKSFVSVDRNFNGWFIGNVLIGGILGMAIDGLGGNVYKVDGEPIHIDIKKK